MLVARGSATTFLWQSRWATGPRFPARIAKGRQPLHSAARMAGSRTASRLCWARVESGASALRVRGLRMPLGRTVAIDATRAMRIRATTAFLIVLETGAAARRWTCVESATAMVRPAWTAQVWPTARRSAITAGSATAIPPTTTFATALESACHLHLGTGARQAHQSVKWTRVGDATRSTAPQARPGLAFRDILICR